jgi:hypothetical protein
MSSLLTTNESEQANCLGGKVFIARDAMTSQQRHIWHELSLKAVMEPDPKRQTAIVVELNHMLQHQRKKPHAARLSRGPRQRTA